MTMGVPCRYAILQFMPYVETGEFANIGVVLACPKMRYLGVKMAPAKRSKRVTDFFTELDANVYRAAIKFVTEDTKRFVEGVLEGWIPADQAFAEITRPRETLVRCGQIRAILADNHPTDTLAALYKRFVERDFATREYQEARLERLVAQTLANANLRDYYKNERVGDAVFNVAFPFVNTDSELGNIVIKPLHLAHAEANKVMDHGTHWVGRMERLKRHRLLPHKMLFAVDEAPRGKEADAAREIVEDLKRLGAEIVPARDEQSIVQFAKQARLI